MASRAVVIGPWDYAADSGITGYSWVRESARMYGKVLAADPMWGLENCRVLGEDEVRTADGVMAALEDEASRTTPGDTFLVVYVGHGAHWGDIPGDQVHFSVSSSYKYKPWTWLSSWYVYRVIRQCRASLKVLIADCCYSNLLTHLGDTALGDDASALPGILGTLNAGTCVLTAVKTNPHAEAQGCPELPEELSRCTPFSGHLLNVLQSGTTDYSKELTLGLLCEAVKKEMAHCPSRHDEPRMLLNDAREGRALFTNRMDPALREPRPQLPVEPEMWVRTLLRDSNSGLGELLEDPRTAGDVVALLYKESDTAGRRIAHDIDKQARERFASAEFARYWNKVERALRQ